MSRCEKAGRRKGITCISFEPVDSEVRLCGVKSESQSLQYNSGLENGLHMPARAILEDEGVRFCYEFANRSNTAYEVIYAPTDPRLTSSSTTSAWNARTFIMPTALISSLPKRQPA